MMRASGNDFVPIEFEKVLNLLDSDGPLRTTTKANETGNDNLSDEFGNFGDREPWVNRNITTGDAISKQQEQKKET